VWGADDDVRGAEVLVEIIDPLLDELAATIPGQRARGPWKVVRYLNVFPAARIAYEIRETLDWPALYSSLTRYPLSGDAWFLSGDYPPRLDNPVAKQAHIQAWNGQEAIVHHDGSCLLVLRRTYYPGWSYRINRGPEHPVLRVDGGLQAVKLTGSGTSRVLVHYQPTDLRQATAITLTAAALAAIVVVVTGLRAFKQRGSFG
jgi:hypothetical protein